MLDVGCWMTKMKKTEILNEMKQKTDNRQPIRVNKWQKTIQAIEIESIVKKLKQK